jgi:hypothetical protein
MVSVSERPDYLVRTVKNIDGREKWTDLGVGYLNAQGSITVYLSALPVTDKIILIPLKREG